MFNETGLANRRDFRNISRWISGLHGGAGSGRGLKRPHSWLPLFECVVWKLCNLTRVYTYIATWHGGSSCTTMCQASHINPRSAPSRHLLSVNPLKTAEDIFLECIDFQSYSFVGTAAWTLFRISRKRNFNFQTIPFGLLNSVKIILYCLQTKLFLPV